MSTANITHVEDATFAQEVLESSELVLLDCWATWCGPCKAIAPVLDEIADAYAGKLKVVKLDVDQNRDTPARLGIRGIPALLLFKEGQVIASKTGAMTKSQLTTFVEGYLER